MKMPQRLVEPLIMTQTVACEPVHVRVAGGEAVLCSFRSPEKEGSNEDAGIIVPLGGHTAVLAVADGVGGTRSAHTASAAIINALGEIKQQAHNGGAHSRAAIVNAIEQANDQVRQAGAGAATTLAAVVVDDHAVRPIHIGDSAVIVVGQRGRLRMQTVSHSPVGYAIEAGVMDEGEAMHHEDRHLVSNVIGSEDMSIEIGASVALARRDTVVLVTDGVLDNLHVDELIDFVRVGPLAQAADRVMSAVQQRMSNPESGAPSKPDDTTMILYRRGS